MKIRRIVTGHHENGQSMVKWDSELVGRAGREGFEQVPLWAPAGHRFDGGLIH